MTVRPRRVIKDNVFRSLFSQSEYMLQLYQALHPEDTQTTEDDITNVTLEGMLVGKEYNDLGFLVKDKLIILVEAQSTWSVNIVIRSLFYLTSSLKEYLMQRKANLYSTTKIELPKPELYVLYTKDREGHPDEISLKEEYFPNEDCCIETKVKIIYEDDSGKVTSQYIGFCKVFSDCVKKYGWTQKAIQETIRICKDRNLLKKYLEEHEAEVIEMMTMLFDESYVSEAYENEIRQTALNEGEARGTTNTYLSLARDNLLSKEVAAGKLGISVAELEKKLQA